MMLRSFDVMLFVRRPEADSRRPFGLRNDAVYYEDELEKIFQTKPAVESVDVVKSCDDATPSTSSSGKVIWMGMFSILSLFLC